MASYGDSYSFSLWLYALLYSTSLYTVPLVYIIIIIIIIIIIDLQMGCPPGGSVNTIQVTYTTK
jgi:hypothetical protein